MIKPLSIKQEQERRRLLNKQQAGKKLKPAEIGRLQGLEALESSFRHQQAEQRSSAWLQVPEEQLKYVARLSSDTIPDEALVFRYSFISSSSQSSSNT